MSYDDELDAFEEAAIVDMEAGIDALCEHSARVAPMSNPGQVLCGRSAPRPAGDSPIDMCKPFA